MARTKRTGRDFASPRTSNSFRGHEDHRGQKVRVGPYTIMAGGTQYLRPEDLRKADILLQMGDGRIPFEFGVRYEVFAGVLRDYGGVHPYWKEFLDVVIDELKAKKNILAFCVGGHGRTGTLLASLVALLESEEETPDPIAAVRKRYCDRAVETLAQAEGIFALRGQDVPKLYVDEFMHSPDKGSAHVDLSSTPQPKV